MQERVRNVKTGAFWGNADGMESLNYNRFLGRFEGIQEGRIPRLEQATERVRMKFGCLYGRKRDVKVEMRYGGGRGWQLVQYNAVLDTMEETIIEMDSSLVEKENVPTGKSSDIKATMLNLAYNLKNNCIFQLPFSSRTPLTFSPSMQRVTLLGSPYDQDSRDHFYNSFEKIIWFSYRRLSQCEDVGWGCMIRVIQMLIAQAITRDQPHLHPDTIIDLFRQQKTGTMALSKICKLGQIGARWTSCPQILSVMSSILSEMKTQQRINFSFEIYCDQLEIDAPAAYSESDFPKLITIHAKIGQGRTIPEDYIFHLLQLAKDRRFVGMASGQRTEALYVVGTFEKKAIILDPHYVQGNQSFGTFFCRNPQGVDFPELASGVSISYYIPSLEEFEEWVSQQIYAQKLSAPFNCFQLLVKDEENWSSPTRRKGSDDFQLL